MRHRHAVVLLLLLFSLSACAAGRHLKQGHAARARGDAVSAQHHFEQALRHKEKLAQEPAFVETLRLSRRDAEVTRGRAAMDRQQWRTAADHFDRALSEEPGFAPAAGGRRQAGRNAAPQRFDLALERADYDDLPAARVFLDDALRLDPQHAGAAAALASLELSQPAHSAQAEATAHADAGRWDAAVATWQRVIDADPHDLPARAARHRVRGDAADHYIAAARAALRRGEPDTAESLFRAVSPYRPSDPRVHLGLAQADVLRGDQLRQADRPGAALLAYRRAAQRQPKLDDAEAGAHDARRELLDRHALRVAVAAEPADRFQHTSNGIAHEGADRLARASRGVIRPVSTNDDGITLTVAVDRLSIATDRTDTQHLQHAYTVDVTVPNPRLPDLRDRVRSCDRAVERLRCEETELCRKLDRARQHGDPHRVSSLEHRLSSVRGDLRRARRHLRDAQRELDCAPAFVVVPQTAHHPYTLEVFTQTGRLTGTWSHRADARHGFNTRFEETDATIPDPQPDLGLAEDPLELTPESDVEALLVRRAAKRMLDAAVPKLAQSHAEQLVDAARKLEAEQNHEQATELRVAAALARARATRQTADADLDGLTRLALPEAVVEAKETRIGRTR